MKRTTSEFLSKKAIYLRVSCSDGRQSTDSQKLKALNYCKANGIHDDQIEVYSDMMSGVPELPDY